MTLSVSIMLMLHTCFVPRYSNPSLTHSCSRSLALPATVAHPDQPVFFELLCVLFVLFVSCLPDFPDLGFIPRVKGIIITRISIVGVIPVNCDCAQSVIKLISITRLLSPHGSGTPSPGGLLQQHTAAGVVRCSTPANALFMEERRADLAQASPPTPPVWS